MAHIIDYAISVEIYSNQHGIHPNSAETSVIPTTPPDDLETMLQKAPLSYGCMPIGGIG